MTPPASGNRPRTLTAIGWLFVAVGSVGIIVRWWRFSSALMFEGRAIGEELPDLLVAETSSVVALVSGVMVLRGRPWARWLMVAWMGFHLIVAALHSVTQLGIHSVIFAVLTFLLFSPRESVYFNNPV